MERSHIIELNIKEAKITDIAIDLEKTPPRISVAVELLTPTGKTISRFTMESRGYNKETCLDDLPAEIFEKVGGIVADIMPCVTRKLNAIDKTLEHEVVA